ncbi:methyltransferase N6AMT1-like isoform X2 [Pecten maximus]|uniref:methyltransferase N6AMT1-like isoform X2 n=1 Tax=Pecten maximus TaxID=6579 RepID=UPI0014589484|nr:methyltransferase N6AMT1-like isoform X2 [Pecten maximus]
MRVRSMYNLSGENVGTHRCHVLVGHNQKIVRKILTTRCTDINPLAAQAAEKTAQQNGVTVQPVLTDLVGCLRPRLKNQVDVLLFNPPYVVTPSDEVGSSGIEASWAGGCHGREVMDRLFPQIPDILSPQGILYLVIIKENKAEEIEDIMKGYGYKMWTVLSRRSGPEFLSILKFTR